MSRSTFSVLFYVNRGKEKNGIVPVMGRVTINCTQSQFSCKKYLTPEEAGRLKSVLDAPDSGLYLNVKKT